MFAKADKEVHVVQLTHVQLDKEHVVLLTHVAHVNHVKAVTIVILHVITVSLLAMMAVRADVTYVMAVVIQTTILTQKAVILIHVVDVGAVIARAKFVREHVKIVNQQQKLVAHAMVAVKTVRAVVLVEKVA